MVAAAAAPHAASVRGYIRPPPDPDRPAGHQRPKRAEGRKKKRKGTDIAPPFNLKATRVDVAMVPRFSREEKRDKKRRQNIQQVAGLPSRGNTRDVRYEDTKRPFYRQIRAKTSQFDWGIVLISSSLR